jgi:hypothetical protein
LLLALAVEVLHQRFSISRTGNLACWYGFLERTHFVGGQCDRERLEAFFELAALSGAATELLWPATTDDDPACRFVRDQIVKSASTVAAFRNTGRTSV